MLNFYWKIRIKLKKLLSVRNGCYICNYIHTKYFLIFLIYERKNSLIICNLCHSKITSNIQISFPIVSCVRKKKADRTKVLPLLYIECYTKKFYQPVKLNKCCARLRSDVVSRVGKRERFGKRRRSGGNNGAGINNTAAKDPEGKKVDRSWTAWLLLPVTITTRYTRGGKRRMLFPVICSAVVAASFAGGKAIITKSSP